ncbi:lipopolysaccharide biosynthesis protein [Salinibacterium sp. GXW1014]|uniref:lipopolysaccharide biosynthesis protein n=1 Tax=Salinibacterium sp. GXW1014 TaxID=3377838 RepID=UPI00383A069C
MIRALMARGPLLARAITLGLNLLLAVVVARLFGASASGEFFLAFTLVNFAGMLGRLGTENYAVKVLPRLLHSAEVRRAGDILKALRRRCAWGTAVAALAMTGAGLSTWWVTGSDFGLHLAMLAISIPFASFAILNSVVLRSAERVSRGAFAETGLTQGLTIVVVLVASAFTDLSPIFVSIAYVCSSVATGLISRVWVRGAARWQSGMPYDRSVIQRTESMSMLTMMGSSVLFFALASTPLFAVGIASSPREAGVFNAAARFGNLIALIPALQTTYLIPRVARGLELNDSLAVSQQLRLASRQATIASVVVASLMIVLSEQLVRLFGAGFEEASTALVVFAIGHAVIASLGQVNPIMAIAGLERQSMSLVMGSLAVGIPAMIIAAAFGGASAVAGAFMLVSIAYSLACSILLYKRVGIKCFVH